MNIEQIKKILPHRYPFLLVDRVLEVDAESIKAYKNVTANEDFLMDISRGNPSCRECCRLRL